MYMHVHVPSQPDDTLAVNTHTYVHRDGIETNTERVIIHALKTLGHAHRLRDQIKL